MGPNDLAISCDEATAQRIQFDPVSPPVSSSRRQLRLRRWAQPLPRRRRRAAGTARGTSALLRRRPVRGAPSEDACILRVADRVSPHRAGRGVGCARSPRSRSAEPSGDAPVHLEIEARPGSYVLRADDVEIGSVSARLMSAEAAEWFVAAHLALVHVGDAQAHFQHIEIEALTPRPQAIVPPFLIT
jgi:hypothetical protein